LLAEWASTDARPVGWVSLDRFDDDPAALLTLLAMAFARIFPDAAEVVAEMRGQGASTLGRSAPLLAAAMSDAAAPFLLVVDDLQEADSPACQDVLEVVLAGVSDGSQVVLAGRHEQSHLARRRVEGLAFEIGVDELRADAAAARVIFAGAGVDIAEPELDALVARSEGWPTGLFLAALLARDGRDPTSVTGDDRFVADYLYRECVRNLPEESQRFLRRSAILEQLSGPVCDAVLHRSDSSALLRELEAHGLFLVPLDHRRGWYRYHALFREFLLSELEASESGSVARLHIAAATWYEEHGLAAQAIEHLLAAGDRTRAARLVAALARPTYLAGQVTVVTRWLSELGDAAIRAYPPLAILACWSAVLTGAPAEAERWAAMVDRIRYDDEGVGDLPAFESARAMLRTAMYAHGRERATADAALAVATEPPWSPWRDLALYLSGEISLLSGDVDAARSSFQEAAALAGQVGITDAVLLSEAQLAILAARGQGWSQAERHVAAALDAIDAAHMEGYPTTALALAVGASVAVDRGDRAAAERLLARGMRARVGCTHAMPFVSMRVRLQLAVAATALGDGVTTNHLLRELDDLLDLRPDVGALADEIAAFKRQVHARPAVAGSTPLTPAELRLLPYLQTHLTLSEIGRRLFISRNTVSSEVGSIYRKLHVTTRSDAVERAVALGLLGA
ncbi:MAG TPA: LuxR C-terminal-related transcriptional regulator, partial [Agromyces mariniharenae]|nr:LuxR C-terminal-related transcriptional regulator [Agromyces mariniharenae]